MPTMNHIESREIQEHGARAAGTRSEPGGRAQRASSAAAAAGTPPLPGLPAGGLCERPELSDGADDELLAGATTSEEIAGPDGLLGELYAPAAGNARWRPRSPSTSATQPARRRPAAPATPATAGRPRPS